MMMIIIIILSDYLYYYYNLRTVRTAPYWASLHVLYINKILIYLYSNDIFITAKMK